MRQYVILERREKRPRRLRIGIPIWFTAVVELKCSSIINHCADILFIQRESRFQKGYPLFYHISKPICYFMYPFKYYMRQCIIFISIGEWTRVYYILKWYN